ncbi:MAG: TrbL/VirB6 family protein [Solirubrobacteraceae bacterium]
MSVCEVPVVSNVCEAASKAVSSVVSAPFEWIAEGVGGAAAWMFKGVWQIFNATTLVNLSEPHYLRVYDVIFGIAIFLMLLFCFLQVITGLIRRDPGALRRAVLGLGKSMIGCFLVVTLTGLALEIVDELCVGIIQASGNTLAQMGGKIAALGAGIATISLAAPGAGAVIVIFLGCMAIAGAAIVWFSLLIRKALLLVAVVLAPFALSGQSWDATRGWFSRWSSFVAAMIVSKLVVVVIFLVAINQMSAPIELGLSSIANPVAGIVLMLIAAFAPYMAYKFISFVGADVHHAMSMEGEARQAMSRPIASLSGPPVAAVRKILSGGEGPDRSGGGAPSPPSAGVPGASSGGVPGGYASAAGGSAGAAGGASAGTAASAEGGAAQGAAASGFAGVAGAAMAGPAAGHAVARAAEQHADTGQQAVTSARAGAAGDPGGAARVPAPPSAGSPVSADGRESAAAAGPAGGRQHASPPPEVSVSSSDPVSPSVAAAGGEQPSPSLPSGSTEAESPLPPSSRVEPPLPPAAPTPTSPPAEGRGERG